MAIALLVTTVLALAGFLLVSVQGFAVASGLFAGSAVAKALVSRHVGYAIPTVLLSLFARCSRQVLAPDAGRSRVW